MTLPIGLPTSLRTNTTVALGHSDPITNSFDLRRWGPDHPFRGDVWGALPGRSAFQRLLGPIASFGCRDFRARTCFLQRYIGDCESRAKSLQRFWPDEIVKFFSGKSFSHQTSESSGITP